MDEKEKKLDLLRIHRESIVDDLDVKYIIDSLISSKTFDSSHLDSVQRCNNRADSVRVLLDIIPKHDIRAYDTFVSLLKTDYFWLWKKLQVNDDYVPSAIRRDHFEDCLSRGDVPRLPLHYVTRSKLEKTVHTQLVDLQRHKLLVLHGMAGSGKSSLAISALRNKPSLIYDSFDGNVFWINVGDCNTDEQIITLQSRVYRKVVTSEMYLANGSLDCLSNISSMESSFHSTCERDWTYYRDLLKDAFNNLTFQKSLLIIDDLRSVRVADAFDVGCKLCITTQDSSYVNHLQPTIIPVDNNLEEHESLQLIGSCVSQDVNKLPSKVQKLHHLCKGVPLWMAILGGMLENDKERLKHDPGHWNYYTKKLKDKANFLKNGLKSLSGDYKPYLTVKLCVNSLGSDELIDMFKSLVVLPDNAKVSTKALTVILSKTQTDVEAFMNDLKKKSLIIEHYNEDLKSYQYEMHDLIASYLKSIHTNDEQDRLHTSLILRYKVVCPDNKLIYLPDDGYIAYYIGYHILNTNNNEDMYSYFNSLFMNLTFIGNKIRLAGPANLLKDFELLEKHAIRIYKKAAEKNFLADLVKFIQSHGHDLHTYPNTDILQSILQHEQHGLLYIKAHEMAFQTDNKTNLYLQFQSEESVEENEFSKIDVQDTVCVVQLWKNYLFIGNHKGEIILWSINSNKKLKKFNGHTKAIKSLSVNLMMPYKLATTSDDGFLRVWQFEDCINDNESEDNDSVENDDHFHDTNNSLLTLNNVDGPYCSGCWGHKSDIVLTHTYPGKSVVLYNMNGQKLTDINTADNISITCSILSSDDSLILYSCEFSGKIIKHEVHVYSITRDEYLMKFIEHAPILMLTLMPDVDRCVLVLTNIHLQIHKWSEHLPSNVQEAMSATTDIKMADIEVIQNEFKYVTCCVAADGSCIFISTTDCRILLYNLDSQQLVWNLNNNRGIVKLMDTKSFWNSGDLANFQVLITKSDEDKNTLKLWCVGASQISPPSDTKGKVKLTLKFDCAFDKLNQISPVTPTELQCVEPAGSPVRRSETLDRRSENGHKTSIRKTTSLDRQALRPLNLRNCSNFVSDAAEHPLIVVIDNTNKIQILRGKKLIIEVTNHSSQITTVALSHCGEFMVYGMKNGVVYKYVIFTRKSSKIMDLNDSIHYLEFLSQSLLVAASESSGLMIYEISNGSYGESNAKMLIQSRGDFGSQELIDDINGRKKSKPDSHESLKKTSPSSLGSFNTLEINSNSNGRSYRCEGGGFFKKSPIVKCFWLDRIGLLTVFRNANVKIWDLTPQVLAILVYKQNDLDVTCVALQNDNLLVMCDRGGFVQIYMLLKKADDDVPLSALLFDSVKLHRRITCCAVSVDSKLLAVGLDNGDIVLRFIPEKLTVTTLSLHKFAVHSMKFSPSPLIALDPKPNSPFSPKTFNFNFAETYEEEEKKERMRETPLVLVSLAGQVIWWNVSQILATRLQNKRRSMGALQNAISPRTPSQDSRVFTAMEAIFRYGGNQNGAGRFIFPNVDWQNIWRSKRYKIYTNRKEILACIRLVGDGAASLIVDDKFSRFVTIDQSGTLYIMEVLNNNSYKYCTVESNGS